MLINNAKSRKLNLNKEFADGLKNGAQFRKEFGREKAIGHAMDALNNFDFYNQCDTPAVPLYWMGYLCGAKNIKPILEK